MSLILFIVLPAFCVLAGKLTGLAVTASLFFSESGKQLGKAVGRWCMPVYPIILLLLMVAGARGNAGHGFTLFGSQEFFDWLCAASFCSVPVLGVYVGLLYVVRDLTAGRRARS